MDEQTSLVVTPTPTPKPKPRKKRRKRKLTLTMPERGPMSRRLPPPPPPDSIVTLNLTIKHSINGQPYGPGPVEVPWSIGQMLAENESRNVAEERGLTERRAHMILPGGRTTRVAPEIFDGDLYAAGPAAISQGG